MLRSLLPTEENASTEGYSWLEQKPGTWTWGLTAHASCTALLWLIVSVHQGRETWETYREAAFPRDGKIVIPIPVPGGLFS